MEIRINNSNNKRWRITLLSIAIILLIAPYSHNRAVINISAAAVSYSQQTDQQEKAITRINSSTQSTENQLDIAVLEHGKPVERELKGGEVHSYTISMLLLSRKVLMLWWQFMHLMARRSMELIVKMAQ
jgi:hypothetical protein